MAVEKLQKKSMFQSMDHMRGRSYHIRDLGTYRKVTPPTPACRHAKSSFIIRLLLYEGRREHHCLKKMFSVDSQDRPSITLNVASP